MFYCLPNLMLYAGCLMIRHISYYGFCDGNGRSVKLCLPWLVGIKTKPRCFLNLAQIHIVFFVKIADCLIFFPPLLKSGIIMVYKQL